MRCRGNRGERGSWFRPNRKWHYCQLAIPSQKNSLVLSLFASLFSKLGGAGGDESCTAVCGDQPAISARHLGTVCPLGSFPWTQQANNGRGGNAAVGRDGERRAAKKTVLMQCLFRAESHTQRQLVYRGGGSGVWRNEFKWSRTRQCHLNYCRVPRAPTFHREKIQFQAICTSLLLLSFKHVYFYCGAKLQLFIKRLWCLQFFSPQLSNYRAEE